MTRNAIVLTSVHPPTPAVKRFAALPGWEVIVVGDRKTPPDWHCPAVRFVSAEEQLSLPFKIARRLPWNHYARKMIGYLMAARGEAALLAESDDDNLPDEDWQFPPFSGTFDQAPPGGDIVNIYTLFTGQRIWPRGFPLTRITDAKTRIDPRTLAPEPGLIGVWQALADEDPDVDAIYRLTVNSPCRFERRPPLMLPPGTYSPFNSQNTAFRRELLPLMYLPALVNFRVTDILRGYVAQPVMWAAGFRLGVLGPSVRQARNTHDLQADFASELPLYTEVERILSLVKDSVRPEVAVSDNIWSAYRGLAQKGIVPEAELELLSAWLDDIAGLERA